MKKYTNKKGFTLIEILIYLALFSIVIGGGMVSAYQIIQSTEAGSNHVILQEEANFIFRKLNWAMTGDVTFSIPSPTKLVLNKKVNPSDTTTTELTFESNDSNLTLKRDGGAADILNSSSIIISGFSFTKISISGKPDSIQTNFTLTTAQNGRNTMQSFSTRKYLRK